MMRIRISLKAEEWERLLDYLRQAYANGHVRLLRRIHALLAILEGHSAVAVAQRLGLSEQSVRNYVTAFILDGFASLVYRRPPGRPPKLTKTQRKELAQLIDDGPEQAGYDCGCWDTTLIQDLILKKFNVTYNPHYVAELLKNMGFSYQRARFVSKHIEDVTEAQQEWLENTWPAMLRTAKEKDALILFGDECSFAQWGSLSYTWSRKGQQPTVKTSGKRKAYKVFGFIEYFSGDFFYQGHTGRFNSDSYIMFLKEVLAQTNDCHLIILQDGASYHTSNKLQAFFAEHADRVTVAQLPKYSPEFNPIEFLWRNIKKQATHLRYFPTFEALTKKVIEKLHDFSKMPEAVKAVMGRYRTSSVPEIA
ncbi:MAG: IS630 family transposase [Planctomycetota bacterium]|jgi:transposase